LNAAKIYAWAIESKKNPGVRIVVSSPDEIKPYRERAREIK